MVLSDEPAAAAEMTACFLSYSAAQTLQSIPDFASIDVVDGVAVASGFPLPNVKIALSMMEDADEVAAISAEQTWGQTAGAEGSTRGGSFI